MHGATTYQSYGTYQLHAWQIASWVELHLRAANVCRTVLTNCPLASNSLYDGFGLHWVHSEHTASFVALHARDVYCPRGHVVHSVNSLSDRRWHSLVR